MKVSSLKEKLSLDRKELFIDVSFFIIYVRGTFVIFSRVFMVTHNYTYFVIIVMDTVNWDLNSKNTK